MTTMGPTLPGFLAFIRGRMGITTAQLPDNSPVIPMAYQVALEIVNQTFQIIPCIYTLMVYNLAGSNVINFAPDVDNAPIYKNLNDVGLPFFAYSRAYWNLNDYLPGVVESSSDQGTSQSLVVQEAAKNFTLANLQQLKDPYGRQYLMFAQSYGPAVWGLTA